MMKRIVTTVLVLGAALALAGVATSSASAGCYKIEILAGVTGTNTQANCSDVSESLKANADYVLGTLTGTTALPDLRCVRTISVMTAFSGNYSQSTCTGGLLNGEFMWVVILPVIAITLAGSAYPLHLNYESKTVATVLEDANGGVLSGAGLKLLLTTGEEAALGTFRADFLQVTETSTGKKCHSTGDTTGTVLTEGSFHLVYTSLGTNLQLGVLYLPNEVKIECEGFNAKVKGSVISSVNLNGTNEATELTNVKGLLAKGTNPGEQQIKEYYNGEGTKVKAGLITTISGIEQESNEQVKEEAVLTALSPDMFVITGR